MYRDTERRLLQDAEFRAVVHQLAATAEGLGMTPGEIKQAAVAAAILVEQRKHQAWAKAAMAPLPEEFRDGASENGPRNPSELARNE